MIDRLVTVGDVRLHVVEHGNGPMVLLVHGFPETAFSWRRQMPALAAAGYRAVALDVRGYGRSSKPADVADYRMVELVADNVGLVRALGASSAAIVGHDWGSPIAANSALLAPDVFTAVALLSIPYTPRGGPPPTEVFAGLGGDAEFYVSYFQRVGRAEREIEPDVRGWLRGFYSTLSADTMPEQGSDAAFFIPPDGTMREQFVDGPLPAWLSKDDLDTYAGEFERTGLTGGLNRYRNVDRDWADLAPHDGAAINQPSLFIGGVRDTSTDWNRHAIDAFSITMPGLSGNHLLSGCGHWVQQEQAQKVNEILIDWLTSLGPRAA
jgi:pimeloyl-ACP methyl ester carboxylesterase